MSAIHHTNGCDKEVNGEYEDEPAFHYYKITDKKANELKNIKLCKKYRLKYTIFGKRNTLDLVISILNE